MQRIQFSFFFFFFFFALWFAPNSWKLVICTVHWNALQLVFNSKIIWLLQSANVYRHKLKWKRLEKGKKCSGHSSSLLRRNKKKEGNKEKKNAEVSNRLNEKVMAADVSWEIDISWLLLLKSTAIMAARHFLLNPTSYRDRSIRVGHFF